jgi:hypothetical protein
LTSDLCIIDSWRNEDEQAAYYYSAEHRNPHRMRKVMSMSSFNKQVFDWAFDNWDPPGQGQITIVVMDLSDYGAVMVAIGAIDGKDYSRDISNGSMGILRRHAMCQFLFDQFGVETEWVSFIARGEFPHSFSLGVRYMVNPLLGLIRLEGSVVTLASVGPSGFSVPHYGWAKPANEHAGTPDMM